MVPGSNPTGVFVWKLLDGEHTIDALIEKLRGHADHVPADARAHIEAFVDALVALGLAGYDSTQFGPGSGPEKLPSFHLGALSEAAPFTYEPPKLVDLSGAAQAAHGTCVFGGSGVPFGYCGHGTSQAGDCAGGALPGLECYSGSNKGNSVTCYAGPCGAPDLCTSGCAHACACSLGSCVGQSNTYDGCFDGCIPYGCAYGTCA